jgi:hypothetical protein
LTRGGPGFDHQILIVIVCPEIQHREATTPEEACQRAFAEVGTMFIVNIPEAHITQHPSDFRDLKEDDGIRPITNRAVHNTQKTCYILNMFQRHFAANEVTMIMRIFFRIQILYKNYLVFNCTLVTLTDIGGINAYASIVAHFTQQCQKLALATADFNHLFATQVIACYQLLGQFAMKGIEGW